MNQSQVYILVNMPNKRPRYTDGVSQKKSKLSDEYFMNHRLLIKDILINLNKLSPEERSAKFAELLAEPDDTIQNLYLTIQKIFNTGNVESVISSLS